MWRTNGIKINGTRTHYIRFTDNIILISDLVKEINKILEVLNNTMKQTIVIKDKCQEDTTPSKHDKERKKSSIRISSQCKVKQSCYLDTC